MMPNEPLPLDTSSRYVRQARFAPFGEEGQRRLGQGRALVCGCGALGSTLANLLVRAGVGLVRIVDRDFVELSNLHRQVLFDEADAQAGLPKAVAAAEKLRGINSGVTVEAVVADVDAQNITDLCQGIDVIVDGTDNFQTRFLVNDLAVRSSIPWVYGGCVGAEGQTMAIVPRETPCLRCLIPECPPPGSTPTCDTAGILPPAVGVIASLEAIEAMKILSGHREALSRWLTIVDLWEGRIRQVDVSGLREQSDCRCCGHGEFPWLAAREGSRTAVLCGRNSVQLTFAGAPMRLEALARRLEGLGPVTRNPFLVRLAVPPYEFTIFADGRTIVSGTNDAAEARTAYSRYIGD